MTPSPNLTSASTPNTITRGKRNQPKSPTRAPMNARNTQLHQYFSSKQDYQNSSPTRQTQTQSVAAGASKSTNLQDANFCAPLGMALRQRQNILKMQSWMMLMSIENTENYVINNISSGICLYK
jgi:hypothetical protein